ncbi:hypothetical protein AQUCO_07200022v1 [Aquilegia coerulea]|uniref:Secreted protein n=1 Tax=Aquilegia coerulea TaxID=218851 RepID=A0A2G5CA16_AQUCA|nr:hypothetical protein AQUCO_07200022v1 [Aquilegia coerulea]
MMAKFSFSFSFLFFLFSFYCGCSAEKIKEKERSNCLRRLPRPLCGICDCYFNSEEDISYLHRQEVVFEVLFSRFQICYRSALI